jgi:putative oxidoreductase
MDALVLVGRILFAALFIVSGAAHLARTKPMAGYAAARGVPAPAAEPMTVLTGLVIIVGALSVSMGVWADLGAMLLATFLLSTAVVMHAFWKESDAQARQMEMTQFLKDAALCGAALMLLAFFSYVGDELGLPLTGPLFDIK